MRKVAELHPEAAKVLALIAELEKDLVPPVPVSRMRAAMKARTQALAAPPPPVGRIVDTWARAAGGREVPVRIYRPETATGTALPALVYFHGGGFVVGDLDMVETICRTLCRDAGIAVVSVDYRLAPEHRYPAAVEDGRTVFDWLATDGAAHAIDARRLAVGGDSAGGNLAAVAARHAAGRSDVGLAYQVLIYPVTDLTGSQPSYVDLGTGFPLTAEKMRWYAGQYVADAALLGDGEVSPLLAASFAGLPPALVVTAGLDPLVDEGLAYARKLRAAGVAAEYLDVPDHPHGFLGWTQHCAAGRETLALVGRRLREVLLAG